MNNQIQNIICQIRDLITATTISKGMIRSKCGRMDNFFID